MLKGRRLSVPNRADLRPTSERVREALFDILGAGIAGAHVLDAYSGSGALGFEALSRGARQVTFIEKDGEACRLLREAARRFGVDDGCRIVRARVLERLSGRGPREPYDLILADPPYGTDETADLLLLAAAPGRLRPAGRLVLERDSRSEPAPGPEPLLLERSAHYGDTRLDFYRKAGTDSPSVAGPVP
jgi:16S rRNA (guanine966-N2)-methyltransferase